MAVGFSVMSRLAPSLIAGDQSLARRVPQDCHFCAPRYGYGRSSNVKCLQRPTTTAMAAMVMATTQEAFVPGSRDREHLEHSFLAEQPRIDAPHNLADDASLNNPLVRQQRMGCGWLGVILEWEGVIVEEDLALERKSWMALAEEEGRSLPPAFLLKRAAGMKNEQVISEVLCWSRDPKQISRMANRKENIYQYMQRGIYRLLPGSRDFVLSLKKYKIPMSIASTRPKKFLRRAIEALGMEGVFTQVVAAEDVYRGKPDPEMFVYAAERLGFIPERCIVFGSSNSSIEAAHEGRMKVVAVAGTHRVFELSAADLVVRRLTELSLVDLKNLADLDSPEFQPVELMEPESDFGAKTLEEDDYRGDGSLQALSFLDDT